MSCFAVEIGNYMNRNFAFSLLLSSVSITALAQDFKLGPTPLFLHGWASGRAVLKTISQSVLDAHRIQDEVKQRNALFHTFLGHKKSYSERIRDRRECIKTLRQEISEANRYLKPLGTKSSQELEAELFSLIALGLLPEEEKGKSLMVAPQEDDETLLLNKPVPSQAWQVPGMRMAPKLGPPSGFAGSIDSPASFFLSVMAVNKSLPLSWIGNRQNPALDLNLKLPPKVSVERPEPDSKTRKVVRVQLREPAINQSTLAGEMNRFKPEAQFSTPTPFNRQLTPPRLSTPRLPHKSTPPRLRKPLQFKHTPSAFNELLHIPPPPDPSLSKQKKGTEADREKTLIKMKLKEDVLAVSLNRFYLLNTRLVALDTEATGLGNDHRMTDIGCVEIQKGVLTGNIFQTYLNPEREVSRYAHMLTGYTWKFLKNYPLFPEIAGNFLRFIRGSGLLIHGAQFDLKLLNEALAACDNSYGKLEEKHVIIDTEVLARKLYPGKRSSLTAVCNHNGINTTRRHKHGALIDSELLAEVFQAMVCEDNFDAALNIPLKVCLNDFYRWSKGLKHTAGEAFFRKIGIKNDLPLTFRFMPHLYHPQLRTHYPAILVAFSDQKDALFGIYARYLIPEAAFVKDPPPKQKIFYGSPENALVTIHEGSQVTLFVGNLLSTLVAKDMLLGHHAQQICEDLLLNKQAGFSIKACFDLSCLLGMTFDNVTDEVIVLMDNDKYLKEIVEHFYNLKIKLKILSLTGPDRISVTQLARNYPDQLLHQMRNPVPINALQDLLKLSPHQITPEQAKKEIESALKIEQACNMYASAYKNPSKPIVEYFRQRGILGTLPPSFRYFARAFHPWTESLLPVIIAPLFNRDGQMTGIHRIFCEPNGAPISDKKHRKVSLGDTAFNVFIDIYKGSIQKKETESFRKKEGVTFISEGIENSLVARDVLLDTAKEDPAFAEKIYERLGITGCFDIRSCVGVNGLAEIPLNHNTRTVVILADNDGYNAEVKQVMINTVKTFLQENRIVKMVIAKGADGQKIDLNDVYLRPNGRQQVAELLHDAVTIKSVEELGDPSEPLQDSLQRLRSSKPIHE
ncbi:MAG: exonuclease domain-containing protein [Myxococcaceae bacterium]